jgi:hypothetical protein
MGLSRGHNYNFRVYAENKLGASQPIELAELVTAKSAIGNLNYYQQIFLSISKLDGNLVIVFSQSCGSDPSAYFVVKLFNDVASKWTATIIFRWLP